MGMSSSQARLLSLTSRMHDIEYKAQKLEAQKLQMANESAHVYQKYANALNATTIQLKQIGSDGSAISIDATYNNMVNNGYIIKFEDKVKVTQVTADNYNLAAGNKDYFIYLETGESGAPAGYTPIYTASQLQNISMNGKYILMSDIDMKGVNWTPLGTTTNPFIGIFDGNGHTISNYTINSTNSNVGLFGAIKNATITNVNISNSSITSNGNQVGGLVGYALNSTISNCTGNSITVKGNSQVGGLIGRADSSEINNSAISGDVKSETSYTGGFVGYVVASTITNSTASVNVEGLSKMNIELGATSQCIGGFVGYLLNSSNPSSQSTIDNCSASGNVTGTREVGGFAGAAGQGTQISNSSATGTVNGNLTEPFNIASINSYNYGGFIGYNIGTITNCSSTGSVSGLANVGGFVGRNTDGTISNSYSTGAVSTISGVDATTGKVLDYNNEAGFVGNNLATITNSYFNSDSAGTDRIASYNTGKYQVTDASIAEIQEVAGPTTSPSVNSPSITYTNNSDAANKASNLFEEIKLNGYEIINGDITSPVDGNEDNSVWFANMLSNGLLSIYKLDTTTGEYYQTNIATDTNLQEVADETELKKAEVEYEASMRKIDAKDKQYDVELAHLENERNAIKTEMDTLKTVIKDNVDRTFKLFG